MSHALEVLTDLPLGLLIAGGLVAFVQVLRGKWMA